MKSRSRRRARRPLAKSSLHPKESKKNNIGEQKSGTKHIFESNFANRRVFRRKRDISRARNCSWLVFDHSLFHMHLRVVDERKATNVVDRLFRFSSVLFETVA